MTTPQFRPLVADDLRLLHEWLQRDHVRRWWSKHPMYEDVVDEYLPAIEGDDPTDLYVIVLGERPVGFIQTYLVDDYSEWAALVDVGPGAAGVDLFIADAELIGRGIGTEVLRAFTREIVFARPATTLCIADPEALNSASIRAFEKAGFRRVRDFVDPSDNELHALVCLERAEVSA